MFFSRNFFFPASQTEPEPKEAFSCLHVYLARREKNGTDQQVVW